MPIFLLGALIIVFGLVGLILEMGFIFGLVAFLGGAL